MKHYKPSRTVSDVMIETLVVWGSFTLVVVMIALLAQGLSEFNQAIDRSVASQGVSK